MKAFHQKHIQAFRIDGGQSWFAAVKASMSHWSEWFWFGFSFLLFLALGPFSAIAVLLGLKSLASEEMQEKMTEPARL